MSERPDLLERLADTAEAVAALRDVFAAEELLDTVLDRVAASASRAIPNADAVTVTVISADGESRTAATTDEAVVAIDKRQYEAGRGPALESAQQRRAVRAVVGEHRRDWPEFVETADQVGVHAYLSVPLLLDLPGQDGPHEPENLGSLNIYSYTATAFDPYDERLVKIFTTAAEQAILNARHWQVCRDRVSQLETALSSRAEIDQAKGVLMAIHGCTADEAFAKLVEQSQHHNIKLNQLARNFLDSVRGRT